MSIIRTSSLASISSLVSLVGNFITNKILAVVIGPEGFATLANIQNLVTIGSRISSGGIETGVVHLTSKEGSEGFKKNINDALSVFCLCLFVSVIVGLLITLNSSYLMELENSYSLIALFLFASPIYALSNIATALSNGCSKVEIYSAANIGAALISIPITYFTVINWGVLGALLALVLVQFFKFVYIFKKLAVFQLLEPSLWFKNLIRKYRNYIDFSIMALVSVVSSAVLLLVLRGEVESRYGPELAGSWQAVWKLVEISTAVLFSGLNFHFMPKFTEDGNLKAHSKIMFRVFLVLLLIFSPGIVISFFYHDLIITLLFDVSFIKLSFLLPIYLFGGLFQIVAWKIGVLTVMNRMTFRHITVQICCVFISYLLFVFCLDSFGQIGAGIAFVVANLFLVLMNLSIHILPYRRRIDPDAS